MWLFYISFLLCRFQVRCYNRLEFDFAASPKTSISISWFMNHKIFKGFYILPFQDTGFPCKWCFEAKVAFCRFILTLSATFTTLALLCFLSLKTGLKFMAWLSKIVQFWDHDWSERCQIIFRSSSLRWRILSFYRFKMLHQG